LKNKIFYYIRFAKIYRPLFELQLISSTVYLFYSKNDIFRTFVLFFYN